MSDIKGLEDISDAEFQIELQNGAKFVCYTYCISIIIMTFRRSSPIYFIRSQDSRLVKGLPLTLLTLILGWWGIPWGPIYTLGALASNLSGGKDVTDEVLNSMRPSEADTIRQTAKIV